MSSRIRHFALIIAVAIAWPPAGANAQQADLDELPPEPVGGEWIEDTLDDDRLWFAASDNLAFEELAPELPGYAPGRKWVYVVDGQPAWVMYYIPGELLGFEVDTHHYGASAPFFAFAVGSRWDELTPIEPEFEEITGFDAKWMRLYRSANALPAGTRFLLIAFPDDRDRRAARLTEVWLRCRFDDPALEQERTPRSRQDINPFARPSEAVDSPDDAPPSEEGTAITEPVIEPLVVTARRFVPPEAPVTALKLPRIPVHARPAGYTLALPGIVDTPDMLAELVIPAPPPTHEAEARGIIATIADFLRRNF